MVLSKKANYKDADQTARMRRLVCICVVLQTREDRFSRVEAQIKVAKKLLSGLRFRALQFTALPDTF